MAFHCWAFLVLIQLSYVTGLALPPPNGPTGSISEPRSNATLPDGSPTTLAKVGAGHPKVGLAWSNGEDAHLYQYVTSKTYL